MTNPLALALSRRTLAGAGGAMLALSAMPVLANARQDAATPEATASPEATPSASPVAATVPAPTTAEVLPAYQDLAESIRSQGHSVLDPLLTGDSAPLDAVLSPEFKAAFPAADIAAQIVAVQANQLRFAFTEVGAYWYGTVNQGAITGFFQQGGAADTFTLTSTGDTASPVASPAAAASPVAMDYPTGTWTGSLTSLGIPFAITLGGDATTPIATLTIESQGITGVPLSDVAFLPEAPFGAVTYERTIPLSPTEHMFGQVREWGGAAMLVDMVFAGETITSLLFQPAAILPEDPAAGFVSKVTYRLPWQEGAWFVFWGGPTVEQNYHAVAAGQRHAYDIVIWKDGSTHTGDGSDVAQYWVWGRPLLAPAAGTVVEILNDQPTQAPGAPLSATNPEAFKTLHPAGNHVVIQTAEHEFVFMAHMQPGSVLVQPGDAVAAGDPVGLAGNSGNTSEPHLHIHVQTVADFYDPKAVGLPLVFSDLTVDGKAPTGGELLQGTFAEPVAS